MKILNSEQYLDLLKSQELSENLEFNDEIVSIEEVQPVEMIDISLNGNNVFYGNDILIHNCAINKTDVDNSAISDSYSTAATADLLALILQNEEMKSNSEVLVKITKNRYTGITDSFMMNIDYPKMRFCEILENQEVPDNALVPFTSVEQKVNAESFAKQAIIEDSKANQEIAKKFNSQTISDDELNTLLGI